MTGLYCRNWPGFPDDASASMKPDAGFSEHVHRVLDLDVPGDSAHERSCFRMCGTLLINKFSWDVELFAAP